MFYKIFDKNFKPRFEYNYDVMNKRDYFILKLVNCEPIRFCLSIGGQVIYPIIVWLHHFMKKFRYDTM